MAWSKGVKTGNTSVLGHVLQAKSLQPAKKFRKVWCTNLISSLTLNEQKNTSLVDPFAQAGGLAGLPADCDQAGGLRLQKRSSQDFMDFYIPQLPVPLSGIYVSLNVHLYNRVTLSEWQD